MNNDILIIITISLIIFISPLVSKKTHIPTIPIEIILGSIAVSLGLIHENHIFELVAELGFLYLMFLAGLEVDIRQLFKVPKDILNKGFIYVILLYIFSTAIALYFNLGKIFIVIMPLISIGLLAALKKEYGDQPWIELSITVGLIGEIVSIVVLTVVSAKMEFGLTPEFYKTLIILGVVFSGLVLIYKFFHNLIWWYPEVKSKLMPRYDHAEQDIRLSMATFFLMIALMLYLHLEVAFGAFVAGVFIRTFFNDKKDLPAKLEHFGFGWLVPIFFISIGASFDIDSIVLDGIIFTAVWITFSMILIRSVSSLLFMKELGGVIRSFQFGLSHSMPLTLLIAVATLAFHNRSIDQFHYYAFILASILEVLIGMVTIRLIEKRDKKRLDQLV
jgi:Kef-type K+ transport system membrane component KefB